MPYVESGEAAGNIKPLRFVRLSTAAGSSADDGKFLQCGAGEKVYGVAKEGSRYIPGFASLDDGFVAISGEKLAIYTENAICLVIAGGTINQSDRLKSDANGAAVATTTEDDELGGIALEAAASGGFVKIRVTTDRRHA